MIKIVLEKLRHFKRLKVDKKKSLFKCGFRIQMPTCFNHIFFCCFLFSVISQYFAIHFFVWRNVQNAERLSIVCRACFLSNLTERASLFVSFFALIVLSICTFSGKGTKNCTLPNKTLNIRSFLRAGEFFWSHAFFK